MIFNSPSIVPSSPLQYPLHPPSHTHPYNPKGVRTPLGGVAPLVWELAQ